MYDIVDEEGGNLLGSYRTQQEALDSIRRTLESAARDRVRDFVLFSDDRGEIAKGEALACLALKRVSGRRSA